MIFFLPFRGMTPEDAELQYLDNARKLPLYGVDLHQAVVCNISFCANKLHKLKFGLHM